MRDVAVTEGISMPRLTSVMKLHGFAVGALQRATSNKSREAKLRNW